MPNKYDEDAEAAQRIARHLAVFMKKRGWTKMRLAEELGINKATVGRILEGDRGVGLGLALRISRRLLISPHDLLLHEPKDD